MLPLRWTVCLVLVTVGVGVDAGADPPQMQPVGGATTAAAAAAAAAAATAAAAAATVAAAATTVPAVGAVKLPGSSIPSGVSSAPAPAIPGQSVAKTGAKPKTEELGSGSGSGSGEGSGSGKAPVPPASSSPPSPPPPPSPFSTLAGAQPTGQTLTTTPAAMTLPAQGPSTGPPAPAAVPAPPGSGGLPQDPGSGDGTGGSGSGDLGSGSGGMKNPVKAATTVKSASTKPVSKPALPVQSGSTQPPSAASSSAVAAAATLPVFSGSSSAEGSGDQGSGSKMPSASPAKPAPGAGLPKAANSTNATLTAGSKSSPDPQKSGLKPDLTMNQTAAVNVTKVTTSAAPPPPPPPPAAVTTAQAPPVTAKITEAVKLMTSKALEMAKLEPKTDNSGEYRTPGKSAQKIYEMTTRGSRGHNLTKAYTDDFSIEESMDKYRKHKELTGSRSEYRKKLKSQHHHSELGASRRLPYHRITRPFMYATTSQKRHRYMPTTAPELIEVVPIYAKMRDISRNSYMKDYVDEREPPPRMSHKKHDRARQNAIDGPGEETGLNPHYRQQERVFFKRLDRRRRWLDGPGWTYFSRD